MERPTLLLSTVFRAHRCHFCCRYTKQKHCFHSFPHSHKNTLPPHPINPIILGQYPFASGRQTCIWKKRFSFYDPPCYSKVKEETSRENANCRRVIWLICIGYLSLPFPCTSARSWRHWWVNSTVCRAPSVIKNDERCQQLDFEGASSLSPPMSSLLFHPSSVCFSYFRKKKRQENGGNGKNWKGREKKGEIKIWGILNFKKKSVPSFAGSGTKLSWVLTVRESESGKEGSVVWIRTAARAGHGSPRDACAVLLDGHRLGPGRTRLWSMALSLAPSGATAILHYWSDNCILRVCMLTLFFFWRERERKRDEKQWQDGVGERKYVCVL